MKTTNQIPNDTFSIQIAVQSESDSSLCTYHDIAEGKTAAEAAGILRALQNAQALLEACKAALTFLDRHDSAYEQVTRAIAQAENDSVGKLAAKFSELLRKELTAEDMAQVIALNAAELEKSICHTHDFIDANEVMAEAFKAVYGREPNIQSDADCGIWSAAWTEAKAKNFTV